MTFNNAPERLIIPLRAITVFADPSVNFVLPFQPAEVVVAEEPAPVAATKPKAKPQATVKAAEDGDKAGEEKTGEVVSLDKFRKK